MITSTANRDIRAVRRLRLAQNRARLGVVLVEGRVALEHVLAAGAVVDRLLTSPRAEHTIARDVIKHAVAGGARRLTVSDDIMALCCGTSSPPSVLAIVPKPSDEPAPVAQRWCGLLVVDHHDPGALGAILLSAATVGIDAAGVTAGSADPWSPKAVRASAAAGWHVPIRSGLDAATWIAALSEQGVTAAALADGVPIPQPLPERFLLVTGPAATKLGVQMRVEVAHATPALPVTIGASHVLAEWARQHR